MSAARPSRSVPPSAAQALASAASILSASLIASVVTAAPTPRAVGKAPKLAVGDSWTYENSREARGIRRSTHNTITVVRSEDGLVGIESHVAGVAARGRETLVGPDWSRRRSLGGRETVVMRSLAFPLLPGKSWTFAYVEDEPADKRLASRRVSVTHRIVGWEEITVPAGTFRALRIDGRLTWTVELASNAPASGSMVLEGSDVPLTLQGAGRTYTGRQLMKVWYVPAVRRWVRSEEDAFDSNDRLWQQKASVLEAFHLADGAAGGHDVAGGSDAAPAPPPVPDTAE